MRFLAWHVVVARPGGKLTMRATRSRTLARLWRRNPGMMRPDFRPETRTVSLDEL